MLSLVFSHAPCKVALTYIKTGVWSQGLSDASEKQSAPEAKPQGPTGFKNEMALLAATQRMHEQGQLLDGGIAKARAPGRHGTMLWLGNLRGNRRFVLHLQPDGIRKVGCPEIASTLGVLAMAGSAVLGEDLLAGSTSAALDGVPVRLTT